MKKQLFALALGVTTAFSAMPIMPVKALQPPIPGDVNLDWTINIADLVCMQKYLMGKGTIDNTFGLMTVDLNNDKKVDVFDYIELRKRVEEWCSLSKNDVKIESRFTQVDQSIPLGVHYARPSASDCIIRSVEDLEYYLSPYNVMTLDGDCLFIDAACQEVLDDLYARYDDEFFSKNILLLNYMTGTAGYEFESIKYEDGKLVIRYYDTTPYGLHWYEPLPPYIAEVAVPKDLWADGDFTWQRVEKPFESQVKYDYTKAVTVEGIKYASDTSKQPDIITNTDQLNTLISGKFRTGIEMSLKDTYNDEFFESNNLILDMNYKSERDFFYTSVTAEKNERDEITLKYDRHFINETYFTGNSGIELYQVVVPKYYDMSTRVTREKNWLTTVNAPSYSADSCQSLGISLYIDDSNPKCFDTEEELQSYLAEHFSEDDLKQLDTSKFDWENNSVYFWIDINVDAEYKLIDVAFDKDQNLLVMSRTIWTSCGDVADGYIHFLEVDKEYSGYDVYERDIYVSDNMPKHDGKSCIFECYGSAFMINQYQFNGKNVADIYQLYHVGMVRFGRYEYIGTIEFETDYFPITDGQLTDYTKGDGVFDEGDYTFTVKEDTVTIKYKYSADSDWTERTFDTVVSEY
ncbi:MAG: dockerin type I repeat-containing protein [Ruminococcus sp.]|nr:dockerin type I repeat-containing protein [Ruminococcus sp.]